MFVPIFMKPRIFTDPVVAILPDTFNEPDMPALPVKGNADPPPPGAQLADNACVAYDAVPISCGDVMLPVAVTLPENVAGPLEISPFFIRNSYAIYLFPIQDYYLIINTWIGNKTYIFFKLFG
jgi:hypothetical protein